MIGYIEGKVLKVAEDAILLLAGHVGYEILLPVVVMKKISSEVSEKSIALHIYYYQTERQPRPILIGFHSEDEKEFFQQFISVAAIGPLKAVKAMEKPIDQIAQAIESQDVIFLSGLKGIGKRTAQKIIATLHGKVSRFVPDGSVDVDPALSMNSFSASTASGIDPSMKIIPRQVVDVLVEQLGYTAAIARKMVGIALQRDAAISTPEQLLDAVLQQK